MYMRLPRTAVWHCEEFDGVSAPPAVAMPAPAQALMITDLAVPGLCANCEQRDTCTFPKQVGGVWHCEEYQ
jgi:hypothetical protein